MEELKPPNNLLKIITDEKLAPDIFYVDSEYKFEYIVAVRIIMANKNGELAMQYKARNGLLKLPGGGAEKGESLLQALQRESREEVGANIAVKGEVGTIIEVRDSDDKEPRRIQHSYCYYGDILGELGELDLDEGEIADKSKLVWRKPEKALAELTENMNTKDKIAAVISERDYLFVNHYINRVKD
jgi:8-oxo-dGTP pyrophosphatase MutT (NUDIX family)